MPGAQTDKEVITIPESQSDENDQVEDDNSSSFGDIFLAACTSIKEPDMQPRHPVHYNLEQPKSEVDS